MDKRWEQVKQILHDAVELPVEQRGSYVARVTDGDTELAEEVRSLLASFDDAEEFLEEAPVQLAGFGDALEGRSIGEYRIEKLIARGGMGSVYLATREVDGFPMRVAVKIIRFSHTNEYLLRRFRMERQILARLQHENIVRMLDGGVSNDGLPFLVTEYIEGKNLQEWLEQNQPSLREKLDLFLQICEGVASAHRSLIVHGDLKPGNILVTGAGCAKLVDFGIARLMKTQEEADQGDGGATLTLAPALTPWWASPEQLRGEPLSLDCDCYELGRILYFLLTGKPAFDFSGLSPVQILERLRKESPPKPSEVTKDAKLEDDLDNITRKALEFEKEQRYRSADALAEDIRRHLELRPVSARPYTLRYRFEKFVRRNRALVAAATAATLALTVAVGAALYQANQARVNYENARQRFEQVRKLANEVMFVNDEALATLQGATPVRAKLVRSALQYLDELARQDTADPRLKEELASAYEKIGDIQGRPGSQNLGMTAAALDSYRKSEAIREGLRKVATKAADFQETSDKLATTYARISAALRAVGDAHGSLQYERKALGIRQAQYEGDPANLTRKRALASSLTTLSGSLSQMADYAGVLETRQEALKMYEELAALDPSNRSDQRALALALARMGSIEMYLGKLAPAVERYRRALDIETAVLSLDPTNVQYQLGEAWARNNLGVALYRASNPKEALEQYRLARATFHSVVDSDEKDVRAKTLLQTARVNTSRALLAIGRSNEALEYAQVALEEREKLSRMNPANAGALGEVAEAHAALASALEGQAKRAKAIEEYRSALRIFKILRNEGRDNAAMREETQQIEREFRRLEGNVGAESDRAATPASPKTKVRRESN